MFFCKNPLHELYSLYYLTILVALLPICGGIYFAVVQQLFQCQNKSSANFVCL